MAEGIPVNDLTYAGERKYEDVHTRLRWSAIFGGVVLSIALWGLLYSLGMAIGLSAVDPNNPGSLRSSGIFTGVWSLIMPIIALFCGAFLASRAAGAETKGVGALHGLVVWGLTAIAGAWVLANVVGSLVGGALSVGRGVLETGAAAVGSAAGGARDLASSIGLDADDALAPINRRLEQEGKPPVRAEQLSAAAQDAAKDALRRGQLDREALVRSIAQNTALSRRDAEELADRIQGQLSQFVGQAKGEASGAMKSIEQRALKTAEDLGKVFWGVFGALVLGLISSLAGSLLGASYGMLVRSERAKERARQRMAMVRTAHSVS